MISLASRLLPGSNYQATYILARYPSIYPSIHPSVHPAVHSGMNPTRREKQQRRKQRATRELQRRSSRKSRVIDPYRIVYSILSIPWIIRDNAPRKGFHKSPGAFARCDRSCILSRLLPYSLSLSLSLRMPSYFCANAGPAL